MLLVSLQASQLRSGNRMRSGMLSALAWGMTERIVRASATSSASPRGISSTEILMQALSTMLVHAARIAPGPKLRTNPDTSQRQPHPCAQAAQRAGFQGDVAAVGADDVAGDGEA